MLCGLPANLLITTTYFRVVYVPASGKLFEGYRIVILQRTEINYCCLTELRGGSTDYDLRGSVRGTRRRHREILCRLQGKSLQPHTFLWTHLSTSARLHFRKHRHRRKRRTWSWRASSGREAVSSWGSLTLVTYWTLHVCDNHLLLFLLSIKEDLHILWHKTDLEKYSV